MAPTIQTAVNPEKRPAVGLGARTGEKRSELVCRVKYCNTLPDIPFDPKFITYPFDASRFIQYNPTSLERNYKYDILTEHDLGVTIDLINRELYSGEFGAQLDAADEKLLEEDVLTPQDSKRSRHHARSVSWLRRTEYISTEQTRFQPQTMDKVEAKVGYSIKKNFKDETLYMDRESQIRAIDKTFADAKLPVERHYGKPNVVAVEILPVFPDFKVWKYPCAQVIFDSDPAPTGRSLPAQIEEMSQAMIRGVMDESGEQFVAYFLPTDETMEKRRRDAALAVPYQEEEEYEYKMAREYNWNVKSKASKGYEENYFLVMRPDGVYYNELETRVRLSKRRQKQGQPPNNTRLVVQHRTLNAAEFHGQRFRERQLEPPGEEEEEEEEVEVEAPVPDKKADDAVKGDADVSGDEGSHNSSRGSSRSGSPAKSVGSRKGRSRSASMAKSVRSHSGSRSRSGTPEKSGRSRSGTPEKSGRSRSGTPEKSGRSRSGTPEKSGRSRSGTPEKSGRSRSGTPEKSGRSRSGSPEKSGRSRSGSPEKSGRSRSGSPEKSGRSQSGSPEKSGRSRSGSPEKSGRSRSGSPEKSGRSRSGSPEKSGRSRSGSPEKSGRSRSGSPEKSGRSRSGSPEKSGRSRSNSPAKEVHSRSVSRSRSVAKSTKSSVSGSGSSSGSASESEG